MGKPRPASNFDVARIRICHNEGASFRRKPDTAATARSDAMTHVRDPRLRGGVEPPQSGEAESLA